MDPLKVHRNFVGDVITATDDTASPLSQGIAKAGITLSIVPMGGEAKALIGEASAGEKLILNAAKGRSFEKLVRAGIGATGAFAKRFLFSGGSIARRTIPDAVSHVALVEIKNVAELSYSSQIGRQIYAAASTGRTFVIVVNMDTKVSRPLRETIEAFNGILVKFNPETLAFLPY